MQAARKFPQSPVRGHIKATPIGVSCKRAGAKRKTASSICTSTFLTQKIEDIRPNKQDCLSAYGINSGQSYYHILKCCKRFAKLMKMNFNFKTNKTMNNAQNLGNLIEEFSDYISKFGLKFFVSKKNQQGEGGSIMECAVYRSGEELDETIVIMYVSPARYLSPKSAELFKRFIKYFSDSTNIPLGITGNKENFYIDSILSLYEDDPYYSELTEEDEDYPEVEERRKISASYNEGGAFWNLFDEIKTMPRQKATTLYKDLNEHCNDCPSDEVNVIQAMAEGVDIVKNMDVYWFEFNPEDDGLPDDYGDVYNDGCSSSVFASAILYSENDGMSDMLLESINSDVNAGVNISGWNIHQYLSPTMKQATIDKFIACKDNVREFNLWLQKYCQEIEKFDLYGKSEKHTK